MNYSRSGWLRESPEVPHAKKEVVGPFFHIHHYIDIFLRDNLHYRALSAAFCDTIVDPDHTPPVALYLVVKYLYSDVCEKGINRLFFRV